jgi:hypothetical protein
MYTRQAYRITVGALWLSPWGGDNGSHTTYLVGEAMYFGPSYFSERP